MAFGNTKLTSSHLSLNGDEVGLSDQAAVKYSGRTWEKAFAVIAVALFILVTGAFLAGFIYLASHATVSHSSSAIDG